MSRRIKNVSARFNMEVKPFQHVRVEVAATLTKEDDPDSVREELVAYAKTVVDDITHRIYGLPKPSTTGKKDEPF